jgi:hypothetical protein
MGLPPLGRDNQHRFLVGVRSVHERRLQSALRSSARAEPCVVFDGQWVAMQPTID